jgi:hypothetical protein
MMKLEMTRSSGEDGKYEQRAWNREIAQSYQRNPNWINFSIHFRYLQLEEIALHRQRSKVTRSDTAKYKGKRWWRKSERQGTSKQVQLKEVTELTRTLCSDRILSIKTEPSPTVPSNHKIVRDFKSATETDLQFIYSKQNKSRNKVLLDIFFFILMLSFRLFVWICDRVLLSFMNMRRWERTFSKTRSIWCPDRFLDI